MDVVAIVQKQIETGKEFFCHNGAEWKLELGEDSSFIERLTNKAVTVFANNGFGDYLYTEKESLRLFEYFHEGPEIYPVNEAFEVLIGLKEAEPSKDDYPMAVYETGEEVKPGDRVKYKVWCEFWKGWQDGKVTYVPGISKKKNEYEYNGLKQIEVKGKGIVLGVYVCYMTGVVKKIKFIGRDA